MPPRTTKEAEPQQPKRATSPPTDHIFQFFTSSHLQEPLRNVSRPFGDLAARIVETAPRNPERTVALRKLLEAKDATVRAHLAGL